jgi:peptidoglycan/LPS O-acetylase OafA/YrhL
MHRTPDAETQDMPYRYSLYLDVLRFLAALAVFLDHLSIHPITKDLIWHRLGAYGSIAVTIFFALSGHVIAHVTATRERTLARYAGARIARMYSVVLVALAATWMLDNLGMALNPDLYAMQRIMWKPQSLEGYAASLLFINEYQIFNFNGIVPGSNGPYWSLSFEVTYYAIAGLCLFAPRTIARPCAAARCARSTAGSPSPRSGRAPRWSFLQPAADRPRRARRSSGARRGTGLRSRSR